MTRPILRFFILSLCLPLFVFALASCVSVRAPERINIGTNRPPRVDASRVPPTSSHEEARQKLAEAYAWIRYLEDEIRDLEEDKEELKEERDEMEEERDEMEDERDEYEKKYEREKDRNDD